MNNKEQKQAMLRAQLKILLELSDMTEEGEDFYSALIDLKSRILRDLRKLKTQTDHVNEAKDGCK
jgi:ribosome-associated translation inhibitor RaiA